MTEPKEKTKNAEQKQPENTSASQPAAAAEPVKPTETTDTTDTTLTTGQNDEQAAQQEAQQSWLNMMLRLRSFTLDDGTKCLIRFASQDEQLRAEEYRLTVIQKKIEGETDPITGEKIKMPDRTNLEEFGKRKGLWTEQDKQEQDVLQSQIKTKRERLLRGKMKLKEGYQLAREILDHSRDLWPYLQRYNDLYRRSAEFAGDVAMNHYLCVCTAIYENKDRMFKTMEEFNDPANTDKAGAAWQKYQEVQNVMSDLDREGLDTEIDFLKSYGFLNMETGDILDANKKETAFNLYGNSDKPFEDNVEVGGFFDDDGNVVTPVQA